MLDPSNTLLSGGHIQTGNCQTGHGGAAAILGPIVAPYRVATSGDCQSEARLAKIACVS